MIPSSPKKPQTRVDHIAAWYAAGIGLILGFAIVNLVLSIEPGLLRGAIGIAIGVLIAPVAYWRFRRDDEP